MTTVIVRTVTVALLVLFTWLAWSENRKPEDPGRPAVSLDGSADPGEDVIPAKPPGGYRNGMAVFTYIIFVCITAGIVVLKWVIPALGDRMAESFYSAPEKVEQTPTHKAMAMVAQGDYPRAIELFKKALAEGPKDRFALTEMVKLHQEKLGDSATAAELLESASHDESWGTDDRCFFMIRLADLYSNQRQDFARARQVLERLIQSHPESNHAANAHHKLNELDEQEVMARYNS